jgi:DeoR/GlpR family transcriptional regulator of sugar metabolism
VKQTVSEVSSKRVLLSDSSKYNKIATWLALPLATFDVIITDSQLSATAKENVSKGNGELLLAG